MYLGLSGARLGLVKYGEACVQECVSETRENCFGLFLFDLHIKVINNINFNLIIKQKKKKPYFKAFFANIKHMIRMLLGCYNPLNNGFCYGSPKNVEQGSNLKIVL